MDENSIAGKLKELEKDTNIRPGESARRSDATSLAQILRVRTVPEINKAIWRTTMAKSMV